MTPVRHAVLAAVARHQEHSYCGATRREWYHARSPFRGNAHSFAGHLRQLERAGLLRSRRPDGFGVQLKEYKLTTAGRIELDE
jgi:DNA-binding PadR family transcriptional regulator